MINPVTILLMIIAATPLLCIHLSMMSAIRNTPEINESLTWRPQSERIKLEHVQNRSSLETLNQAKALQKTKLDKRDHAFPHDNTPKIQSTREQAISAYERLIEMIDTAE